MRFFEFLPAFLRNWAEAESAALGVSLEASTLMALWSVSDAVQGRLHAGSETARVRIALLTTAKAYRRLALRAREPVAQLEHAIAARKPGEDFVIVSPDYWMELTLPSAAADRIALASEAGKIRELEYERPRNVILGARNAIEAACGALSRRGASLVFCEPDDSESRRVSDPDDHDAAVAEWFRRIVALSLAMRVDGSKLVTFSTSARRFLARMRRDLVSWIADEAHALAMMSKTRQIAGVLCAADFERAPRQIGIEHVQVAAMVVLHFDRYRPGVASPARLASIESFELSAVE